MRSFVVSLMVASVAMAGCRAPCKNNLPPAEMLMHPGPGVDGPGPGVMMYQPGVPSPGMTSQIAFVGPEGMTVTGTSARRARSTRSRWSAPAATTSRKGPSTG